MKATTQKVEIDDTLIASIKDRRAQVLERIAEAARRAGRPPEAVRLVVVSKAQPLHVVEAAIAAGVRTFGENYAEEAVQKIQHVGGKSAPRDEGAFGPRNRQVGDVSLEWHMIGHIQSRKARLVAPYFDLIHSLDSVKLAGRLNQCALELGRTIPVLLELNVGGETAKSGWPAADEAAWPMLTKDIEQVSQLSSLQIEGLMTMPPLTDDPEEARTYFRRLRKLQGFLTDEFPMLRWAELSMGTSADYAVAVEEGATLVRVGEAILGRRPAPEVD